MGLLALENLLPFSIVFHLYFILFCCEENIASVVIAAKKGCLELYYEEAGGPPQNFKPNEKNWGNMKKI